MIYEAHLDDQGRTLHGQITREGTTISFSEFINGLKDSAPFRSFYNALLARSAFESYFWEHPPISKADMGRPYEFILVESNNLHKVSPDPKAFAQYFTAAKYVADFPNLSGDTHLIAPTPKIDSKYYTHLGSFVRHAPPEQQDAFWQRVGECYALELEKGKRWLSTAGMGVYWLHVRVGTGPKYYRHSPYRKL